MDDKTKKKLVAKAQAAVAAKNLETIPGETVTVNKVVTKALTAQEILDLPAKTTMYSAAFNIFLLKKQIEKRLELIRFAKNNIQVEMYKCQEADKIGLLEYKDKRANMLIGQYAAYLEQTKLLDPEKMYAFKYDIFDVVTQIGEPEGYGDDLKEYNKEVAIHKAAKVRKNIGGIMSTLFHIRPKIDFDSKLYNEDRNTFFKLFAEYKSVGLMLDKIIESDVDEKALVDVKISLVAVA